MIPPQSHTDAPPGCGARVSSLALCLWMLVATGHAPATESTNASVEHVQRLCTKEVEMCEAYFMGIKEILVLAAVTAAPGNQGGWFAQICMPRKGVATSHIVKAWQDYLAAHRVDPNAPAVFTVLDAAVWRWPCS